MEGFLSMKGKVVDFDCTEASKMIAIVVFVGLPVGSFLHVYAESLWSLALRMFQRRHKADLDTRKVKEEDWLGLELDCAVCLCPVSGGEKSGRLLACNHGFHDQCIDAWLQDRSTCPLCRSLVAPLSPHHPNDHQQQRFYDRLFSCFFSPFEKLCKWMETPLNIELSPALYENSTYLF